MTQDPPRSKPPADDLARLFALSQDLLTVASLDGSFLWTNPHFTDVLGWTEGELASVPFLEFVHPDDRAATVAETARLGRGERVVRFLNRYRCKDGSHRTLAWAATPDPERGLIYAIARDVTREAELERIKDDFVSTVSHELRTPLTSIRGALGLLSAGQLGRLEPRAAELVRVAHRNTQRLAALIDDLLDIEKLASGRLSLDLAPVDAVTLLNRGLVGNRAYAESFGVRLELATLDDTGRVLIDEARVLQVLDNLLSNAIKYSARGGVVTLVCVAQGRTIRFEVIDRGPGIPEAFRPHVFERFTRADDPITQQRAGTGLGLAIAKAIVAQHQGRIGFDTGPGGTTMWFELPRMLDAEVSPETRALVVTADGFTAACVGAALEARGLHVATVPDAPAARAALHGSAHALVVVDILLPDAQGPAFVEELRRTPTTATVPLVVTALSGSEAAAPVRGGVLRVASWIRHPLDPPDLDVALAAARVRGPAHLHALAGSVTVADELARVAPAMHVHQRPEGLLARLDDGDADLVVLDLTAPPDVLGACVDALRRRRDLPAVLLLSDPVEPERSAARLAALLTRAGHDPADVLGDLAHLSARGAIGAPDRGLGSRRAGR